LRRACSGVASSRVLYLSFRISSRAIAVAWIGHCGEDDAPHPTHGTTRAGWIWVKSSSGITLLSVGQSEKESTRHHAPPDRPAAVGRDTVLNSTVSLPVYRTVSGPAHGLQVLSSRWEKKPNVPASGFLLPDTAHLTCGSSSHPRHGWQSFLMSSPTVWKILHRTTATITRNSRSPCRSHSRPEAWVGHCSHASILDRIRQPGPGVEEIRRCVAQNDRSNINSQIPGFLLPSYRSAGKYIGGPGKFLVPAYVVPRPRLALRRPPSGED